MRLLVLTIENYQDIEVHGFIGTIKRSGKIERITYWNPNNKTEVHGANHVGTIKTECGDVDVNNYDAIFIPGGSACISLRTDVKAINLIKEFINKDKWVFAICDGPNALFDNNIFVDKNYSSYPIENINNISGKNRNKNYVTVDGKYITGKCPSAALDMGVKVIEILYGKELATEIYNGLYGLEK